MHNRNNIDSKFHSSIFFQVIGLMGTVHRITERGDVRVQYPGFANRWTFHPASLTQVIMQSWCALCE